MMGLIEESLRDTFASQVAAPPAIEDAAGAAIRRAVEIRRRRVTVASAAAAVSVLLAAGGVVTTQVSGRATDVVGAPSTAGQSAPAPPPVGAQLPIDVLNRDRIQIANGEVLLLSGMGEMARAWRVSGGWLVQAYDDSQKGTTVWLIDEKGHRQPLVSGRATMVSRGSGSRPGIQIAWVSGGKLTVGRYVAGAVVDRVETDGADFLRPWIFVGGGVLLGGTSTGGGTDIWDMWFPDRGAYKETAERYEPLSQVVGVTADNAQIIGLYGKPPCVGIQDPREAIPNRSTCELTMGLDERVYASPNGGWWAVTSMTGVRLYPAPYIWTDPQLTGELTRRASSVGWLGTTLVVIADSDVLELSVPTLGVQRSTTLPAAGPYGNVSLVEDLRDIEGMA